MEEMSHGKQVLVMVLGELAFLVPAVPLYIFLVLPNYPEGSLPGILPLIGGNAGILPSILATLGFFAAALAMASSLYFFFGKTHFFSEEMQKLTEDFTELEFVLIYLAAGIGEEALFRAALLEPCGIVLSSLLFTLLHIAYWRKPLMLVYVFSCGLIFGGLYIYTGSLLLCVIVHAAFNTVVSIILKRKIIVPRG